jgi:hypothetical protein
MAVRNIIARSLLCATAVGLALVALPSSGQANLVQNGDFAGCTGTTCSPWIFVPAAEGSEFEFLLGSADFFGTSPGNYDSLSQTITTTPGDSYTISFNLNVDDPTTNQGFVVDFGTSQLLNLLNTGTSKLYTFDVDASGSSTALDFMGYNVPSNTFLSEVSVTPDEVATPVPAALPLFATGLGALGLLGWRRKRKVGAAIVAA